MKKNVMMRVASIMLVLVLMSSSVISGTFAKYVTADNGGDSARVAHWGVTVDVTGDEAFKTTYATDTNDGRDTDKLTVVSSTAKKLLAPGTSGTFAKVDVNGTPEVDATIEFAATVNISDWKIDTDADGVYDNEYYCPLVITIGSAVLVGNEFTDAQAFADAIEAAFVGYSNYYNAHSDLATVADVTADWAWNFNEGSNGQTDVKDTLLGDKAAVKGDEADFIEISLEVTVTQVN